MDIVSLLVSLVGGAIGGNVAGPATQEKNPGALWNTVLGLIGGGAGTYILQALGVMNNPTEAATAVTHVNMIDWSELLKTLAAGGGSGAIVTAIVAFIKGSMGKNNP